MDRPSQRLARALVVVEGAGAEEVVEPALEVVEAEAEGEDPVVAVRGLISVCFTIILHKLAPLQ